MNGCASKIRTGTLLDLGRPGITNYLPCEYGKSITIGDTTIKNKSNKIVTIKNVSLNNNHGQYFIRKLFTLSTCLGFIDISYI